MVKVVSAQEMGRIEKLAYQAGASERSFMEAAGAQVAGFVAGICEKKGLDWCATLLCGKGNNAGDAYVAGKELKRRGYRIRVLQLVPIEQCGHACRERHDALKAFGGEITYVASAADLDFFPTGVIVDGLFGTGFKGEVTGLFADAIEKANNTMLPIVAIDIPSGVNGTTGWEKGPAICATATVYLGLPKTGFFLGDSWNFLGQLHGADFGLEERFIEEATADFCFLTEAEASHLLPPLVRNRHKYQAGYVVGLAGSVRMPGASMLTAHSALKGGAGIVRMLYPQAMLRPAFLPEVLAESYEQADQVLEFMQKASATLIGPGLGTGPEIAELLQLVLAGVNRPTVLDADGLNTFAKSSGWRLPEEVVFTPHVGEMLRLLGLKKEEQPKGMEWIETCGRYSSSRKVALLVKGAPTFVFDPTGSEPPTVIGRGDPGMATAGCGDVLTGLIAALLAQGVKPFAAAKLGAYIHALAGEEAAAKYSSYSMVASDVIESLGSTFHKLQSTRHANGQIAPCPHRK